MLKNILRKTLSVVLSIMMLLTTCSVATSLVAHASVNTGTGASTPDVIFVVPEVIYLQPTWNSYYQSIQMPFQFYVNNTVNSSGALTLKTGEENRGQIYFRYANATNANITFTWVDSNGSQIQGGMITFGDNTSRAAGIAYSMNSGTSPIYISAGESPLMSASQTGAYLRWTATFTDNNDHLSKSVSAYTYVYKPYIAPVGVAQKTCNDRANNHYGQSISWISGVHGVANAGTHYANTTVSSSGKGFLPFSSSGSLGVPVGNLNAQFASTSDSASRFYYTGMNNVGVTSWLNTSDSSNPLPNKTIRYFLNDLTGHSSGDDAFYNVEYSPTATLTADTSRYSNFNQIPNISAGLMVTDDEDATTNGAWYVADYTGSWMADHDRDYFKNQTKSREYWDQYRAGTILGFEGNYDSTVGGAEAEGVKYNGRWNRSFTSSGNFAVATGYYNHDSGSNTSGDSIWHVAELRLALTARNNASVRNALQNAIRKAATLQSLFYDANNSAWLNFNELYRAGYMAMIKLDGSFSAKATVNGSTKTYTSESTFVTDLNSAMNQLTGGTGRLSRNAVQTNVAISEQDNGTYRVVEFKNGTTTQSKTFTTFNTVTISADSVTGYSFAGVLATSNAESYGIGSTLASAPRYTTEAAGATISSNGVVTYPHATTQGTDNKGNIYYTYFYTTNKYTVRFDANGGSGSMTDQAFVYGTSQALSANLFTRKGYSFIGWSTTPTGEVQFENKGVASNLTGANNAVVILYAKWSADPYSISYDTNGGQLTGTVVRTYDIETPVLLPTAEKAGYKLTGWRSNSSGNWGPILYTTIGSTIPAGKYGDVTFTAVWETISYTVTYNANGGTGSMQPQTFVYDQVQNLTPNAFSRTGYSFRGWAYSDTDTNPAFNDKDPVINLTDADGATVNLFAVWGANTYTIVYKEDGGYIRDTIGTYTSTYTLSDRVQLPVQVEKPGYTFTGWMPSANSGSWNTQMTYTGIQNSGMTGNVTLVAQWTTTGYLITYNADGGTITGTNYTTSYNILSAITLPSVRKTGYTFQGWLGDDSGNWGESVYAAGKLNAGMYGNVTLQAQWIGVTYYISFNSNGGTSGVMRDQTMVYGQSKALSGNAFVRSGYVFLGWAESNTASTPKYADGATVSDLTSSQGGVVTLYAVWSKEEYTITYEPNGGTITTEGTTKYTTTDRVAMPAATRRGFVLNGWTPAVSAGNWVALDLYNGILAAGMYGNVTLRAQWSKLSYTITWLPAGGTLSGKYTTEYDIDTAIVLPAISRSGFAFSGWQADEIWDSVFFTDAAPTGKLGDVTITAVWVQRNYTVAFHPAGGTGEMEAQSIQFDVTTPLKTNTFEKLGYNFVGWTMTEGGNSAEFTDGANVYNLSASDGGTVNLYAVWSPITFSVSYNLNGASGFLGNSSVSMDGSVTLREPSNTEPVINGHAFSFAGWALTKADADAGVVAYAGKAEFALNSAALNNLQVNWSANRPVITLYAVWTNIEISLVLVEDSGAKLDAAHSIVYGIDQGLTAEDMSSYLQVAGNGHLEYEYNAYIGTGSIVKLYNDYTGALEGTYTVVLYGDLNGDGVINSTDLSIEKSMVIGATDASFNSIFAYAADINNDGDINNSDLSAFKSVVVGAAHLDQSTRELTQI